MLSRVLTAAAIAGAGLLLPAGPASASTADASTAAVAASVPTCVDPKLDDSGPIDHLWVTNKCGSTQRVKVIIANGNDFSCVSYSPGERWHFQWSLPGRFDGLSEC